jgi:hypothetical protein
MSITTGGGYFSAGNDTVSAARLDQKTITIDTSARLSVLSPTYPGQIVIPLDTSGAFIANNVYYRNAANTAWLTIVPPGPHDHSSNTTGGPLSTILDDNIGQFIFHNLLAPKSTHFKITTAGTGATVTDNISSNLWNVDLNTGSIANNTSQADLGGIRLDFGSVIKWIAKVEQAGNTNNIQCRMGVNIEAVGSAASNSTKSLGFEFCDSTGTTYQLESGDGTLRSVLNTTQPFTGVNCIRFLYTPALNVVGQINHTTAVTKTSNLPNSGNNDQDKMARFGIQTTDTNAKHLYLYGVSVGGYPNDFWYL